MHSSLTTISSAEVDLKSMFDRYGRVQTCIINEHKRHAFVKMASRADAVAAREAMEQNRASDSQLRVRTPNPMVQNFFHN